MVRKTKRLPPSKIKYNKNHPTVSARLPKDKRDKLLQVLKSLDVTLTQLLLHFIDEYEIKVKPVDEARKVGYEEAKKVYMITYPCSVCKQLIGITSPKAKEAASKYMTERGWAHAECLKNKKPLKK